MEVVVSVQAARTTTSQAEPLGVITLLKRELITSETEAATDNLRGHRQL
jgi:hypothetical protein